MHLRFPRDLMEMVELISYDSDQIPHRLVVIFSVIIDLSDLYHG